MFCMPVQSSLRSDSTRSLGQPPRLPFEETVRRLRPQNAAGVLDTNPIDERKYVELEYLPRLHPCIDDSVPGRWYTELRSTRQEGQVVDGRRDERRCVLRLNG